MIVALLEKGAKVDSYDAGFGPTSAHAVASVGACQAFKRRISTGAIHTQKRRRLTSKTTA